MNARILLLVLVVPLLTAADDPDPQAAKARYQELVKEWKDIRKSPDWTKIKRRRDIIVEFGDMDQPGVLDILYRTFLEDREQVCRIPAMIGLGKQGNTKALKAMVSAALRDRDEVYLMNLPVALSHAKDEGIGDWLVKSQLGRKGNPILKAAIIESLGHLRSPEAYEPIRKILAEEKHDVRIAYECLIALGRIGGTQAFDVICPYLESKERFLREGAVVALGETGHPQAVEKALPLAKDVFPRAQEAVAELIGKTGDESGIPTLIDLLRTGRLRVIDTARNVLEKMTGERFGIDAGAWEKWWKDKQAGKLPAKADSRDATSVATYYGFRIFSDRVLFVLDISGSMKAGEPPRIDTAREELTKTLDELNEKTLFNIVGFSGAVMWWKDSEVKATKENVKAAKEFVAKLSVGGGTNIYDTFEEALEKNKLMDTIFFLGDGSPSVGKYTEQEEILARLRFLNRFRKVRINTIALIRGEVPRFGGRMGPGMGRGRSVSGERYYDEEEAARFLARMAAENGGGFRKIDK